MKSTVAGLCLFAAFLMTFVLLATTYGHAAPGDNESESRVKQGLAISPVTPNMQGKNRALVGLGSYLVNAVGSCNDCHTCPSFKPGHNPYDGIHDGQVNADNFLAGGVAFGPFVSANLTPSLDNGLPEGNTFEEFKTLIRTGHEPDGGTLQVMPWPILRNMTDHDLRAIYEYLGALPHLEPGTCNGPGE